MAFDQLRDIPGFAGWRSVEEVNKGWSSDRKFRITTEAGQPLLLRLAAADRFEVKEREFAAMGRFHRLGIHMSEPLGFGRCGGGEQVYTLLSWLEGEAVDEVIEQLPEGQQYRLGLEAGRILRQMHSLPAPSEQPDWEQRMRRKFEVHLQRYRDSGLQVPGDQVALAFVADNLQRLSGRPQVLQHGDYHVGNMILGPDGRLGIIDFNRWDYGDPYEDFYKLAFFSRERSIPFCRGQVAGYFPEGVPEQFFPLLALYVADVMLFSAVWAIPFGPAEVEGMLRRAEMIMADYQGFQTAIPGWW